MNLITFIILIVLGVLLAAALWYMKKKPGCASCGQCQTAAQPDAGCGGSCSGCSGCCHPPAS